MVVLLSLWHSHGIVLVCSLSLQCHEKFIITYYNPTSICRSEVETSIKAGRGRYEELIRLLTRIYENYKFGNFKGI